MLVNLHFTHVNDSSYVWMTTVAYKLQFSFVVSDDQSQIIRVTVNLITWKSSSNIQPGPKVGNTKDLFVWCNSIHENGMISISNSD